MPLPVLVDQLDRVDVLDLLGRELEVLGPQPDPSRPRDALVERDDVHLGVVEERVRVQVRRPEREPAVVDDPDLRVHVHGIAQVALARVDRAREEAGRLVRRVDERGDLSARDVRAVVRSCGQEDEDAEVVARRVLSLSARIATISGDQRNWFSR